VAAAVLEPLVCSETAEMAGEMLQEQVKVVQMQQAMELGEELAVAITGLVGMEQKDISVLFIGVQTEC
jgi:hypothetical protein